MMVVKMCHEHDVSNVMVSNPDFKTNCDASQKGSIRATASHGQKPALHDSSITMVLSAVSASTTR